MKRFLKLLSILALTVLTGCSYSYPVLKNVTKIEVKDDHGELLKTLTDQEEVMPVVEFVNQRRSNWRDPYLAPPASWAERIEIYSDAPRPTAFAIGSGNTLFARTESDGKVRERSATLEEVTELRRLLGLPLR